MKINSNSAKMLTSNGKFLINLSNIYFNLI
jgi:hypothetical protein